MIGESVYALVCSEYAVPLTHAALSRRFQRGRFYLATVTPEYRQSNASEGSQWATRLPPLPRGPFIDAMHPNRIQGNLIETTLMPMSPIAESPTLRPQVYAVSIFCIDIDDGNERYVITENVCITNGTAGLKTGAVSDGMAITNNIVVQLGE